MKITCTENKSICCQIFKCKSFSIKCCYYILDTETNKITTEPTESCPVKNKYKIILKIIE